MTPLCFVGQGGPGLGLNFPLRGEKHTNWQV
jgi:hypothetical protein